MNLSDAQVDRRTRGELLEQRGVDGLADELCDALELFAGMGIQFAGSDAVKNYQLVGPDKRKKLKGLIDHYRKDPHPFTACVADNTKRFGAERAKKVCAVLTDLEKNTTYWRGKGKVNASEDFAVPEAGQPPIDAELFDLLAAISAIPYKEITDPTEGDDFAAMSAKQRKKLPPSAFVFPKGRRYPIHDKAHAANALARVKGKQEEPIVKAAVCKRHPDLPACQSQKGSN